MVSIELLAWVVKGPRRIAIIKAMDYPMTASLIQKKIKPYYNRANCNNTTDVLKAFEKKGIAVSRNGGKTARKLYELTDEGKKLREEIIRHIIIPITEKELFSKINPDGESDDIKVARICDALREFIDKGIAKCLNPEQKNGRLYVLTEEGERIREELMGK